MQARPSEPKAAFTAEKTLSASGPQVGHEGDDDPALSTSHLLKRLRPAET
jgi:hypothetical protein